jgi:hypothetical protein
MQPLNIRKNKAINVQVAIINDKIIKESLPKFLNLLKMDYLKEILIRYEKFEHLYLMPFLMIIKILKRLNKVIILYNKKDFSLKFYLNGISIILGTVYILYIDYPIFIIKITGNQIGMISSFLSFACSISADLIERKTPDFF